MPMLEGTFPGPIAVSGTVSGTVSKEFSFLGLQTAR